MQEVLVVAGMVQVQVPPTPLRSPLLQTISSTAEVERTLIVHSALEELVVAATTGKCSDSQVLITS